MFQEREEQFQVQLRFAANEVGQHVCKNTYELPNMAAYFLPSR